MALRAVKPETIQKRFKAFFYGASGVGKTMASIQFPSPYIIDTEGSCDKKQYVDAINKSGGAVFVTQDFNELMTEIRSLMNTKHQYKTLVIDSLTILYNDLIDKSEKITGTEFGRHYGEAAKKMKLLLNLLFSIDMNVIITSHSKNEYVISKSSGGKDNMTIVGNTFDCYKKLDYLFDIVFEIQKRGDSRVGIVKKTRIESFPDAETFPFNYDEVAKRYGAEVMERVAITENLATKEQIERLAELVELYKEPQEIIEKWLAKANADTFDQMSESVIIKLIAHMENKAKPKTKGEK